MTTDATAPNPSLVLSFQVAIGVGFLIGLLMGLIAFDWAGFELGKSIGERKVNRMIDTAAHEAVLYKTTGYHSLREMIMDYEDRQEIAIALRQFEADFLAERAAFLNSRR